MFVKYKGFKRNGVPQTYVDERFEYFLHYWRTLDFNREFIFSGDIKFESHLSLIFKIKNQLYYNYQQSQTNLNYLFLNHSYFKTTNLFIQYSKVSSLVNEIKAYLRPDGTNREDRRRLYKLDSTQEFLKKKIGKLENILRKNDFYLNKLVYHLIRTIGLNEEIDESFYSNIKYLVNSYIAELYKYGYSREYIFKLPDILIFKAPLHDFPFPKIESDFESKVEYQDYIKLEKSKMTLSKTLNALKNLVSRKIQDGYYIFKIDDFCLLHPQKLTIGEVEFYNPQLIKKIKLNKSNNQLKLRNYGIEYFSKLDDKNDVQKASTCNAIVKTKFINYQKIDSPFELYDAFRKVDTSLSILNQLTGRYSRSKIGKGSVSIEKHIRLFEDRTLNTYSLSIYGSPFKNLNIDETENLKYLNLEIELINKLDLSINSHSLIFQIRSLIKKYSDEDLYFNFKELWILWDSLMDYEELLQLFKDAIKIYLENNFLVNTKILLANKLESSHFFPSTNYYTLPKSKLDRNGIKVPFRKRIPTVKFLNNYSKLKDLIPIPIIYEISNRLSEFIDSAEEFYKEIDKWIEDSLREIYIQRNMEVHHSDKDELSRLRLKKDFLFFSQLASGLMIEFIDKRNPKNMNLTLNKIRNHKMKKSR